MDSRSSSDIAKKHEDLGIKEFVGHHSKVIATFKERYSDFHVHEIDTNGQIVHLTDLKPPVEKKLTVSSTDPDLIPILSEEIQKKVGVLYELAQERKRQETVPVEINVTALDKQQRTKIHRWVANYDGLSSSTIDKDDQKYIVVEYATPKSRRRPETRGRFTNCVMYKEGMDTSDAIMAISKRLKMNHNLITYAGTKDKQAKTTQRITVTNVEAKRLIDVSNQSSYVKLGNFEYAQSGLKLGDLKGNHFKILLKNVRVDEETCENNGKSGQSVKDLIQVAMKSFKDVGFINFYGLQRFGSFATSTHTIGKAVLQMKWDRVFDLILEKKPRDPDFMVEAKQLWFSQRDPQQCLKFIPSWHRSIESNLFHGLARHYGLKDYLSAFQRIPRYVRQLYLHAFQSYLWNHLATFRIQKFGLKAVVGDFVNASGTSEAITEDISLNINDDMMDTPEVPAEELNRKYDVKVLKEEDLDKYSIYDVLIPLFGTELVKHPNRTIQDFYDNLLLEQGLDTDCFLKFKPRHEAPKGSYRHLIIQPKNVDYKIFPYDDSDNLDKFIPSDLDLLKNSSPRNAAARPSKDNANGQSGSSGQEDKNDVSVESEPQLETTKDKTCVVVEFSLPSASYATMALRELIAYSGPNQKDAQPPLEKQEEANPNKRTLDKEESPENKAQESESPAKKILVSTTSQEGNNE